MVTTQVSFMILWKYGVTVMSVIISNVVYEMCHTP